jgi:hypothetical protein
MGRPEMKSESIELECIHAFQRGNPGATNGRLAALTRKTPVV